MAKEKMGFQGIGITKSAKAAENAKTEDPLGVKIYFL